MKKKILIILPILFIAALLGLKWWFGITGFKNGHLIVRQQHCSDYCPGYGDSAESLEKYGYEAYFGIDTEEECEKIAGQPIYDYGFGKSFIYCRPN